LQRQNDQIGEAIEQAKLRISHDASASYRGTLISYVEEQRQKIFNWLAAPDHESMYRNARSVRQETTGS
jgi:hypothetical protein